MNAEIAISAVELQHRLPDFPPVTLIDVRRQDAFISRHALDDAALAQLARIVRAADTGTPDAAPEAAGLLAMSIGLSTLFADDHAMLRAGMLVYDSLYASCRSNVTRRQAEAAR